MTLKFLVSQGAPYIYDISRLRVKLQTAGSNPEDARKTKQEQAEFIRSEAVSVLYAGQLLRGH
jgi:hypothetical protein